MQPEGFALRYAQQVIECDGEIAGPSKGLDAWGEALATLSRREHELAFGIGAGELPEAFRGRRGDLDERHRDELDWFLREHSQLSRAPSQVLAEFARLTSVAVDF